MDWKREVRISDGCLHKKSWGKVGVILNEYVLNGSNKLLVDINGNWLLVDEMFVIDEK